MRVSATTAAAFESHAWTFPNSTPRRSFLSPVGLLHPGRGAGRPPKGGGGGAVPFPSFPPNQWERHSHLMRILVNAIIGMYCTGTVPQRNPVKTKDLPSWVELSKMVLFWTSNWVHPAIWDKVFYSWIYTHLAGSSLFSSSLKLWPTWRFS